MSWETDRPQSSTTATSCSSQPEETLVKTKKQRSARKVAEVSFKTPSDKAIKHTYPSENLNLASQLEGTVKAVEKAVTGVLADHGLRYRIPLEEMAPMCKELHTKIGKCEDDPSITEAALAEDVEDEFDVNEGELRGELVKYVLMASGQFNQLSFGTMLSIVKDLDANGTKMHEYEMGYPAKLASSVNKFYDLTEAEFTSQSEENRLKMNKRYLKQGLRHHQDVADFLKEKERSLEGCSEGRVKELSTAFKRNQKMGAHMKNEYGHLKDKGPHGELRRPKLEEMSDNESLNLFRNRALEGKMGVRSEEEEAELEELFEQTPVDVKKTMKKRKDGKKNQLRVSDVPTKTTKAKPLEYQHAFTPNPSIYLVDDYM